MDIGGRQRGELRMMNEEKRKREKSRKGVLLTNLARNVTSIKHRI